MNKYRGSSSSQLVLLIVYDIADDKRRRKVVRTLESYGSRVQESVYECFVYEYKLQRFIKAIQKAVTVEDKIRAYKINGDSFDFVSNSQINTSLEDIYLI